MELKGLIGGTPPARGDGRGPPRGVAGRNGEAVFRDTLDEAGQAAEHGGSRGASARAGAGRGEPAQRAPSPPNAGESQPADAARAHAAVALAPAAWLMPAVAAEAAGGSDSGKTIIASQPSSSGTAALRGAAARTALAAPAVGSALPTAEALPQGIALRPPGSGLATMAASSPVPRNPLGTAVDGATVGPAAAGAAPPGTAPMPADPALAASDEAGKTGMAATGATGRQVPAAGDGTAGRAGGHQGSTPLSTPGLRIAAMQMAPGGPQARTTTDSRDTGAAASDSGPATRPAPAPSAAAGVPSKLARIAPSSEDGTATPKQGGMSGPQPSGGGVLAESAGISAPPPSVASPPGQPASPPTAAAYFAGGSAMMRAVTPQITAAIESDPAAGRIELRLDPPELGKVEIAIDIVEQSLRATLTVERPATHELFRRHGETLLAQLHQAGFAAVDLRFAGENAHHPQPGWPDAGTASPGPAGRPEAAAAEPNVARPAVPRRRAAGLDLRL
jgi:hypothetical protein